MPITLLLAGLLSSCVSDHDPAFSLDLRTVDEEHFNSEKLLDQAASVLFFLSPECPLCLDYAETFRRFNHEWETKEVGFYGVFPTKHFTKDEIRRYRKRFDLEFPFLLDPDNKLTKALEATTTPEVIMLDSEGRILYRGSIDNWAYSVGRKKIEPDKHYLLDALQAWERKETITLSATDPVGCLIE